MKKEAAPKMQRGSLKKTSNEKRGNPSKCKRVHQKNFGGRKGTRKVKKNSNKNEH
jgi:hypothetical protein